MSLASPEPLAPSRFLLPAMLLAQVGALLPHAAFPALVPTFKQAFALDNSAAGWVSGIYYLGYMVMVPVLMGLTDRMDARRVYLGGAAVTVLATLAFAFWAQGFWSALVLRVIAGAGLAALYMPGLRILSDRMGTGNSRAITLYTAHYALGVSLSFLLAGAAGESLGWRWAFILVAAGPALSFLMVIFFVRPHGLIAIVRRNPFDFRPVLRNQAALRFVGGYALHGYEIFAERAWIVAMLTGAMAMQPGATILGLAPSAAAIAAVTALMGLPGSVIGNEGALRWGRERLILAVMLASFSFGVLTGVSLLGPFWLTALLCLIHALLIAGDSGALTSGLVASARKGEEGVTIAFHSMMGFGASFLGPLAVGFTLDAAADWGWGLVASWTIACVVMGAPQLAAPFLFKWRR